MEAPESMKSELAAWNNGAGIDLESLVGCEGRFSLAVGYAAIFWPEFVEFEGYILRKGFSESSLRGFELQEGTNRKTVEWLRSHTHFMCGCGTRVNLDAKELAPSAAKRQVAV